MTIAKIIAELNAEITRLEQIKKLLSNGRNFQLGNLVTKMSAGQKKGALSTEARKKIAKAQRKRWAALKAKK
jgi:hypothetical protein